MKLQIKIATAEDMKRRLTLLQAARAFAAALECDQEMPPAAAAMLVAIAVEKMIAMLCPKRQKKTPSAAPNVGFTKFDPRAFLNPPTNAKILPFPPLDIPPKHS